MTRYCDCGNIADDGDECAECLNWQAVKLDDVAEAFQKPVWIVERLSDGTFGFCDGEGRWHGDGWAYNEANEAMDAYMSDWHRESAAQGGNRD